VSLSQKCQYALRGLFELARRNGGKPVPISAIAAAQAIPPRFLELIFGELRQVGYVASRRGANGGYMLSGSPAGLSVGEVIRFVDGPLAPVRCLNDVEDECPLHGRCAFMGLWQRAADAVADVYDSTTLQDLLDEQDADSSVADYCI